MVRIKGSYTNRPLTGSNKTSYNSNSRFYSNDGSVTGIRNMTSNNDGGWTVAGRWHEAVPNNVYVFISISISITLELTIPISMSITIGEVVMKVFLRGTSVEKRNKREPPI